MKDKYNKELHDALLAIEKEYGKGSIMSLGERASALTDVEGISTGALSLDLALGGKGLPRGRIIEIFGPEASGKTTVTLHAVANAQRNGGVAAFIDAEHALDPGWAKRIGVDLESLLVSQPSNAEEAFKIIEMLVKSNSVDLIVVDSVAALVPQHELEGNIGDTHVGLLARMMSQALRMLTAAVAKSQTCLIFINQLRAKIGAMLGDATTTAGGNALKYYASVRIDIRRLQGIKQGEEVIGSKVKVKIVKNKIAPPFRSTDLDLLNDRGISYEADILNMALEEKLIEKSGAWFTLGEQRFQGEHKLIQHLRENPQATEELRQKILTKLGVTTSGDNAGKSANADSSAKPAKSEAAPRRKPATDKPTAAAPAEE
jgi:recombination protein RecA